MTSPLAHVSMPPSLTAFTSRRLSSSNTLYCPGGRSSSRGSDCSTHRSHSTTSGGTFITDSAIGDDSEDEYECDDLDNTGDGPAATIAVADDDQWEDDCSSSDYDAQGCLVFRRVAVSADVKCPAVSILSQMVQQQHEAGVPVGTVAGMTVVGSLGSCAVTSASSSFSSSPPDPLRSHPPPLSASPIAAPTSTISPCNLRRDELNSALYNSILDENRAHLIVHKRCSRRWTGVWEDGDGSDNNEHDDTVPVRRTQSAPDMRSSRPTGLARPRRVDDAGAARAARTAEADTVVRRGMRELRSFRFRKFEYVDDYVAPRSWTWYGDYHSRGW